ncbi:RNA-binding protein 48 [Acanthochromis polyacanthus]|uniref:RNA-binding protein 48 n=1 Tax=Acanthochromis polyacanthus TaxID=80966 RepID=A0A3Q1GTJ6_9TELE|nr:RNA-binding protein 48 [Acanthochromis polyacanthus]
MAAPVNKNDCWRVPEVYKHHEQRKVCISRPKYREGRKDKAVKVYTINLESRYLMVQGVPAIGVMTELIQLCALYGAVEEYRPLDEYPAEEFTEVYLVKFQKLTSARAAKRHMDEKSFYGGVLHVCYVPEYETVEDTRLKLQDRRGYVRRAAQYRAREREQKEAIHEEPTSSETTSPSDQIINGHIQTSDNSSAGEILNISHYSSFPPLPLPPQEHHFYGHKSQPAMIPTEDKMGTLHNVVPDTKQQQEQSSSSNQTSYNRNQGTEHRLNSNQAPAVRFVPRTTHLQNRKRKMEVTAEHSVTVPGQNEPLIGPKLPEPSKLDMEDESLNTTVGLIRNTMKQVGSVSDLKPVEKKVKPRRRI